MYISSDHDKIPTMSQKELSPAVGDVASTNYILSVGYYGEQEQLYEFRSYGIPELRKTEYCVPSLFFGRRGNNNTLHYVPSPFFEQARDNNNTLD